MATTKKVVSGIMSVNSDVINTSKLSQEDFDAWYRDEHIPDVVAKSGIQYAYRYEHISDGSSPARKLKFLTLYGMKDLAFMESQEFKSLEGQSPGPSKERIFDHAEFDTRAYECVQVDERPGADSRPAPLLLYVAMDHMSDAQLNEWYRSEHVPEISKCPGYRRTTHFKLVSRSILSKFERSFPGNQPTWLALHEFEGPNLPWKELQATDETEWAKKVIAGIREMDFGVFALKRVFGQVGSKL